MTVYKKNGKYYCRFKIHGRQKHLLCHGAKSEKEAKAIEDSEKYKLRQVIGGIVKEEKLIKFKVLCDLYRKHASINLRDIKHAKSRVNHIENFFKPNSDIKTITKSKIEQYKATLLNEGKAPATVNRYLSILHKIFTLGIDNKLLEVNPFRGIKKITEDNLQYKYWQESEEKAFLSCSPDWLIDIVEFTLCTGLRKTNVRLFEKSWIDTKENIIKIPKSKNKGKKFITIPIGEKLSQIIKRNINSTDYLFVNSKTNKPYSDDRLAKEFNNICKIANVSQIGFHGLRHTVATRLLEKGIDIITVKELLAHSSLATTERYTHSNNERKQKAINILENY